MRLCRRCQRANKRGGSERDPLRCANCHKLLTWQDEVNHLVKYHSTIKSLPSPKTLAFTPHFT